MKYCIFFVSLALVACSDDAPSTDGGTLVIDVGIVDRPAVVDTAPEATVDAGADVAQLTDSVSDVATDSVDASAPADASDAGGMFVDGCFVGTPATMNEILNRCGGAVAFPARAARGARLLPDGGVQALGM